MKNKILPLAVHSSFRYLKFIFILWACMFQQYCFAQSKTPQALIDSLLTVLPTTKEDTNKVKALYMLCDNNRKIGEYDKGLRYGNEGLALAQKIKFKKGEAKCYKNMGVIYMFQNDYPKATDYYAKALTISQKIGDREGMGAIYNNLGNISLYQTDYGKALDYYFKSLAIDKELGDKSDMSMDYTNIGNVYLNQSDYPTALDYYLKGLKMAEEIADKDGTGRAYNNIGGVYLTQGDYPKALDYYFKALKIKEELADKKGMGDAYNNLGITYNYQNNYTKSLEYYYKAINIREALGNKSGMAQNYSNIGWLYVKIYDNDSTSAGIMTNDKQHLSHTALLDSSLTLQKKALKISMELQDNYVIIYELTGIGNVYLRQQKYNNAIVFYQRSYNLADSLNATNEKMQAAKGLSDSYKKLNDWRQAFSWNEKYMEAKDSVFNETKNKEITSKALKYEFEKKQLADSVKVGEEKKVITAELKQERTKSYALYGGLALMLVVSVVFFRQRNKISMGKKRSDDLLLNILPAEVAEELKETGTAKAKSFDNVTILFTDFKNFTQASEKLSAEELVQEINYCYSEFDRITTKYGIEKIKTIGDSYMCAGGLPSPNNTHPWDVVKAGLELQQFIIMHKEKRMQTNEPYFELRLGIHTGPVVAGIVGIKKFAYDIWGDTVNTASRMESSGATGKVNISGATYELVKDKFKCAYRGKVLAKNKGEIDMYFVEGEI